MRVYLNSNLYWINTHGKKIFFKYQILYYIVKGSKFLFFFGIFLTYSMMFYHHIRIVKMDYFYLILWFFSNFLKYKHKSGWMYKRLKLYLLHLAIYFGNTLKLGNKFKIYKVNMAYCWPNLQNSKNLRLYFQNLRFRIIWEYTFWALILLNFEKMDTLDISIFYNY